MATSPLNVVIQHLRADPRPKRYGMTDGELLARFLRSRDGDALAALVERHASMVWGVCRRHLDHHDAEDAFQATFLVLVRKAANVPEQAVANWLYGVARQTAIRMRATAAKQGRRETQVMNMPEPSVPEVRDADLQALDEELSRLPDHYRCVIILCDLECLTRKEAAHQLGIPEGSVASRLARAREMLGKRMVRRGGVAAALGAGSVPGVATARVPSSLLASTVKAAHMTAAGKVAAGVISPSVAALTTGVMKAMFMSKFKVVLAVVSLVGIALGGVGLAVVGADDNKGAKQPPPLPAKPMVGPGFVPKAPVAPPAFIPVQPPPVLVPRETLPPVRESALEQKLVGSWIGQGACVGEAVFQADGTYFNYGYGPGAGLWEIGTWKIDWSELPPTLVLKPLPTEGGKEPEPTKYFLMKLSDKSYHIRWVNGDRIEEHRRGNEMTEVAVRISILERAVQRYLGHEKHGAGVKLPPNLKTLVDTKILPSASLLVDPWGGEIQYDLAGKNNRGDKPDIWIVTKDKKIIGNWLEQK